MSGPSSQTNRQHTTHPGSSAPRASQNASSQEEEVEEADVYEEESRDELYCIMSSKIVGVQYYKGMVGPGEEIRLIREPHNAYDS